MGAGAAEAGVRARLAADEKTSKSVANVPKPEGVFPRFVEEEEGAA